MTDVTRSWSGSYAAAPPGSGERRAALVLVVLSLVTLLVLAPFAQVPLPRLDIFIPAYELVILLTDLSTAWLLFSQFTSARSRALLVLASGYLFTASIVVPHALTFPGLFAPAGLLDATAQSTAWLYMFWHGLFPLLVIGYALIKGHAAAPVRSPRFAILCSAALVVSLVCGFTWLATAGADRLPPIMQGNGYAPMMKLVVTSVWSASLAALLLLWLRRPHTVLDLWLMVVMCTWMADIALSAVLNAGRFDLGFYAGRVYGLVASSFVLVMLQTAALDARLAARLDR